MGCGFGDNHVAGRMTSFGWKRKRCLHSSSAAIFKKDEEEDSVDSDDAQVVDWLSGAKKRRAILLEDCQAKSKRLQDEGVTLAENERYWEAIKHWDEALELTPSSAVLHEMKSQVLSELSEVFPAVAAAEKAVQLDPTWSVAWQTLARAQIGLGEVLLAQSSAQKSIHLDPTNMEVWEDLKWIEELVAKKKAMSTQLLAEEERERNAILEKRTKSSKK